MSRMLAQRENPPSAFPLFIITLQPDLISPPDRGPSSITENPEERRQWSYYNRSKLTFHLPPQLKPLL